MKTLREETLELIEKGLFFSKAVSNDDLEKSINSISADFALNQINLIVAGEVSVGKSYLINNLLGENVCTINAGVCTSVVSVIKYGEKKKISVCFFPKDDDLPAEIIEIKMHEICQYVSETHNKDNHKGVAQILIELPNEKLKSGLVLYDTPGLGSLNPQHAAITFSIAAIADGLIFVSDTVRELNTEEIQYAQRLIKTVRPEAFIHVVAKSDLYDLEVIIDKNRNHLTENLEEIYARTFCACGVSNTTYSDYLTSGNKEDLEDSGFNTLFKYFDTLVLNSEDIVAKKYAQSIETLFADIYSKLTFEKFAIECNSKEERKKILEELREKKELLNLIKNNQRKWELDLEEMLIGSKKKVIKRIISDKQAIIKILDNRLLDDSYLKGNKLSNELSSEIGYKLGKYPKFYEEELLSTYSQLITKSGVEDLWNTGISSSENKKTGFQKDGDLSVGQMTNIIGTHFSRDFRQVALVGSPIGAIIGTIIGTVILPGLGTLWGAGLGAAIAAKIAALWAVIKGIFMGKKRIREAKVKKLKTGIEPIVTEIFDKQKSSLDELYTKAEIAFYRDFDQRLTHKRNVLIDETNKLTNLLDMNKNEKQDELTKVNQNMSKTRNIITTAQSINKSNNTSI